jgi:hypothetical protein
MSLLLAGLGWLQSTPLPVLDLFFALNLGLSFAISSRRSTDYWARDLCTYLASALGGSTMAALLLGQPPGWALSLTTVSVYIFCWFCSYHAPSLLLALPAAARRALSVGESLNNATCLTVWGADAALNAAHPAARLSPVLPILCGALTAYGGGALRATFGWAPPRFAFSPAALGRAQLEPLIFGAALAAAYYVLCDPHGYLRGAVGATLLLQWAALLSGCWPMTPPAARAVIAAIVVMKENADFFLGLLAGALGSNRPAAAAAAAALLTGPAASGPPRRRGRSPRSPTPRPAR